MEIDLDALKRGSGNEFMAQIQNVPQNLNEQNLSDFYEICVNLFNRKDLSRLTHTYVLQALISAVSQSQENIETFIQDDIPGRLPFKLFYLQEKLLDLVFLLANYAPHGITKHVAYMFGHLISQYPRKCLTILSIFSERFQIVFDPWPMVDLLFKYQDFFCKDEGCVDDYLSLLVFLNTNSPDFREARQKHCWQSICNVIQKVDDNYQNQLEQSKSKSAAPKLNTSTLSNCYYSLCHIYESNPSVISYLKFPKVAERHLIEHPSLQHPILSLLMRVPPNGCQNEIINSLVSLIKEQNHKTAGITLALIAKNRACALALAKDLFWLQDISNENIDIVYETLTTVLEKPTCQKIVANSVDEVVPFLQQIISNDTQEGLFASSTVIRRLPIDIRVIFSLSRKGFLGKYYEKALSNSNIKNEDVAKSTFEMTSALAKKGDAVEFSGNLCAFVDKCIRSKNCPYREEAIEAAVQLAQHPRCAKEFQTLKLNDYFDNIDNDENAVNFLENFNESVGRPVTAPLTPGRSPRKSPFSSSLNSPKSQRKTPGKEDSKSAGQKALDAESDSISNRNKLPAKKPPSSRRPKE